MIFMRLCIFRVSPETKETVELGATKTVAIEVLPHEDQQNQQQTDDADPLEPWSTRDIKDMNSILSWKEPGADSP